MGSDDHAQTTANLLSIVASAKLHDLEAEDYVRDLLRVLPHWPRDRYLELAPKYWRATRERLDAAQLEAELGPLTVP
ncbi:MAG: transposase domain-containing protein, partial [Deltaproteobacteria bacterium]